MKISLIRFIGLVILMCVFGVYSQLSLTQEQCGIADTINYPIDRNVFRLSQDYGSTSPRHQGRFHTGEDWFIASRSSLGQPVTAAANGRVTYSAPTGWGRDGGVVIIEHRFADGEVIYTQYGHMMQTETVTFPTRLSCVEVGDVIGAVGDVRPAPHLHFEVRVNNPDVPGAGYTREIPDELGWRRPEEVIMNMNARLNRGYEWSVSTGIATMPLVLTDNSLMVANGTTMRRITPDGRILWRVTSDKPVTSIEGFQANPLVFYADGTVGRVDFEGTAGDRWQLDFQPDLVPLEMGDGLLFHTADDTLTAISGDRREVLWQLEGIPAYDAGYVGQSLIALIIADEVWLISREGVLVDQVQIDAGASFASMPNGDLLAYTQGGLWRINAAGEWTQALELDIPPGNRSRAVVATADGRIFLTDGTDLYAFSRTGTQVWVAELPQTVSGDVMLNHYDDLVLLTSNHGNIIAAREGGGFCGYTQVYGQGDDALWHDLGEDGILRVQVGQQVIGLDWEQFNAGC